MARPSFSERSFSSSASSMSVHSPTPSTVFGRATPLGRIRLATAYGLSLLAERSSRWRAYLARFDIEHAFKTLKRALGLTAPKVRTPQQAGRWVRLVMAAHAQIGRAHA